MAIPYPHFNIPELKSLNSEIRALVWKECVHPFTLKFSNRVLSSALFFAFAALGGVIGNWFIPFDWGSIVLAALAAGIGSYFESWVWAWRYREEIQIYLTTIDSPAGGK